MQEDPANLIQQAVSEALSAHGRHRGESLCYAHLWIDPSFESQILALAGDGITVWRDTEFPERYLLISMGYGACEEDPIGLKLDTAQGQALIQSAYGPPDHVAVMLEHQRGVSASTAPLGSLVSISARTSGSGQGKVLMDEVDNILDSLQYIDGFLGSAFGARVGLEEEVVGIVFWKDAQSFHTSTPRGSFYEIRLFGRIL